MSRITTWFLGVLVVSLMACSGFASDRVKPPSASSGLDLDGRIRVPSGQAAKHRASGFAATSAQEIQEQRKKLSESKEHSPEWWQAQEKLERLVDSKLSRSMTICAGCLKPEAPDTTGTAGKR